METNTNPQNQDQPRSAIAGTDLYFQTAAQSKMTHAQFEKELAEIRIGLDKDLGLKDSSGLVNPLGMREASEIQERPGNLNQPNFGKGLAMERTNDDSAKRKLKDKYKEDTIYDEDYHITTESGSGSKGDLPVKDSPSQKDLTIDMLQNQNPVSSRERQRLEAIREAADPMSAVDQYQKGMQSHLQLQRQNSDNDKVNMGDLGASKFPADATDYVDQIFDSKVASDGFSLEQFRQNNAQLQQIMMQLQKTPQFPFDAASNSNATSNAGPVNRFDEQDLSSQRYGVSGSTAQHYSAAMKINDQGDPYLQNSEFQPHYGASDAPAKIVESEPSQSNYASYMAKLVKQTKQAEMEMGGLP